MAIISTTSSQIPFTCNGFHQTRQILRISTIISLPNQNIYRRLFSICNPSRKRLTSLLKPISATGLGLEASTSPKISSINIKDAKVVLESKDGDKLKLRVDLSGKETDKVFNLVLKNLALTAPPVPGFRKQKGGKMTNVPKDFLLQILGEDRVTNFVIQEIVSTTLADYAQKENLNVKENKVSTVETSDELKSSFVAGKEFGFTATLEIEEDSTTAEIEEDSTTVETEATVGIE
ncbi:uncharacterized protein LOC124938198 isoform X2 [Impatiens glandulifera]|uniref:uncharacterized protein LOC124938198 isoform X2 n=1 Tax=Impatiens glandulifera TaxID=253017 RepID=UPI001FB126B2|nr:uncharacterized protein LOC124938198 isoform X2 [Impatiens glandulifera]